MRKLIVIVALTTSLFAQIPEEYKPLSTALYGYIDDKEYTQAMDVLDQMLIVSMSRQDEDMQYRIANTMSALGLTSDETTLLHRAYDTMQHIPLKKRDAKYYWLITKLSQKLTNMMFPSSLYHMTMCMMAITNNEEKYIRKCENKDYFLSNFFNNYQKNGVKNDD